MDPVQAQVDAYNARDIDAFVAPYAEDVVALERFRLSDGAAPWAAGYLGRAVRQG